METLRLRLRSIGAAVGIVDGLEIDRRYVAEVAVQGLVVIQVDPAKRGELKVANRAPGFTPKTANQLGLVEGVTDLHRLVSPSSPVSCLSRGEIVIFQLTDEAT